MMVGNFEVRPVPWGGVEVNLDVTKFRYDVRRKVAIDLSSYFNDIGIYAEHDGVSVILTNTRLMGEFIPDVVAVVLRAFSVATYAAGS